ncbi:hypothetical protein GGQ99_005052 [Aminobacter niigataensis]|uniref:Uncharacterized protein n=1 Tax=Aminobacter niigataensis TaxID=83265 RepID=A0ABR6L8X9_9HYPH|nr:hypothetical protein [Aminobacter niigataensis]MBB4653267.1 hypothetical protein [Aminobacter niigataensis]
MAKIIPSWKARQGQRGYQVLLVLVGALLLIFWSAKATTRTVTRSSMGPAVVALRQAF